MFDVALTATDTVGEMGVRIDGELVGSLTQVEGRWALRFTSLGDFTYFCDEPGRGVEAAVNCRKWGLI